jgi:3-(3-hydroxy-phenyl)propionate hydroxylase
MDIQTAAPLPPQTTYDVAIVGAGPVGLIIANTLGAAGLRVIIIDALGKLIDYPRGVGMDDESLRAFQGIGLVQDILPHITHHQIMRLVTGKGRVFASIDPQTDEFGWPRRNAFIQPLIDQVLADGLSRYPTVRLALGHTAQTITQDASGVTLDVLDESGAVHSLRAAYLVGADGGRSMVRRALDIPFEGKTNPNRWIVVDIANDPMGLPNAYLHADPRRPYACIALPHGIRRLEFMLFDDEGKDGEVPRDVLDKMLARVMPHPEKIDLIRARIYTHNGRLAAQFRKGRVLLAGDAAHIMPVWQGQGYNSGVRDATNLGWKLARVASGICGDSLLDSYEAERRDHAKAMISLSETVGAIFATRNPVAVWARDAFTYVANFIPSVKRYFLEMRFKPMPRYKTGASTRPRR